MAFPNVEKIVGFKFIKINNWIKRGQEEPLDGNIEYNGNIYYFKLSHEYDSGNTYIVYNGDIPVFYFLLEFGDKDEQSDNYNVYDFPDLIPREL